MPAVFNAANEVAVELFMKGKIGFLTIYEIIEKAMERHIPIEIDSVETVKSVDRETREWVYSCLLYTSIQRYFWTSSKHSY